MDIDKTIAFLENSFLRELFVKSDITDISYNGQDIYYVDNFLGRLKSKISITKQEAKDFVRQIANLTEKQFSFQNPNLDVSFGKWYWYPEGRLQTSADVQQSFQRDRKWCG